MNIKSRYCKYCGKLCWGFRCRICFARKKTNLSKIRGNRNYKDRIKNYDP